MSEPLPWTKIYNRIKAQIPAAPDAVIRQEIFNTMIDFTQDTNLWLENVQLSIMPNTLSYDFEVTDGRPNRLMLVYRSDDPVKKWADQGISMSVPGTIELMRGQPQAVNWTAIVAKSVSTPLFDDTVTPARDTGYPAIDDWIVDQFSDVIYYGTMWYLQRQPAKAYRDPIAAKENAAYYGSQKSQAKVTAQRRNVYGGQNWLYPQSFATITRKGWQ